MLPEALSNGMCSLKAARDRLVMSALMEFDAAGRMKILAHDFRRHALRERMTYTNVNKVLEGDAEMTVALRLLAPRFRDMKELR